MDISIKQIQKRDCLRNKMNTNELGVSENSGTPKSSIEIGVSIINHPFWGIFISGNTQLLNLQRFVGMISYKIAKFGHSYAESPLIHRRNTSMFLTDPGFGDLP